jgi:short-subunit dehydrogenase
MSPATPGLAVVTGASSGIGREIARELARRGHPVLAVARRADRLAALADEVRRAGWAEVHPLSQDVAAPGAAAAVASRAAELGGARWLVNDAGAFSLGPFEEDDPELLRNLLRLNVEGLVLLTRALLPQLLAAPGARILNVASLAGLQPTPWYAAYGASKAFLVAFSESLSEELRGRCSVTAFCPGPVRTEIFEVGAPGFQRRATRHDAGAEEAARAAVDAAVRGLVVAVPGLAGKALTALVRLSPRALVRRVSRSAAVRYIGFLPPRR